MGATAYAIERVSAAIELTNGSEEARIERLFVNDSKEEEIRFSWWRRGRLMPRPLDLNERDLLALLERAIDRKVLTPDFRARLRELL